MGITTCVGSGGIFKAKSTNEIYIPTISASRDRGREGRERDTERLIRELIGSWEEDIMIDRLKLIFRG